MDEFNNKNKVGEVTKNNDISSNEQERESEIFCENVRKRKNTVGTCADKIVKDVKTEKRVKKCSLLTISSYEPNSCCLQQV